MANFWIQWAATTKSAPPIDPAFKGRSSLLEHDFSRLNDDRYLVSLLEIKLFGAAARNHAFYLVFSHADGDMGHDIP